MLPPNCPGCSYPGILLANLPAWEVLQITGSAMFDGMGGLQLASAREVAAALGHPWERGLIKKIIRAAAVMAMKAEEIPGFLEKLEGDGD